MQTEPTPQFIKAISAAIEYWRRRTETLDDAVIARLDEERQNLYRAVEFGLKRPETWQAAAEVALQAFDLVERRGYWREWIPMLEAAVVWCGEAHWPVKFKLLNRLGQLQRKTRRLSTALTTHHEAETIAKQIGDELMLAEVHYHLSGDYLRSREHDQAEQHGIAALTLFKKSSAPVQWIASTLNILGEIARSQNNLALAQERLVQAVTEWRRLNQPLRLARTLNDLAHTLTEMKEFEQAQRIYMEATELLIATTNELDKVMIHINLGLLYFRQQQWEKAEAAFRQANSTYLRQSAHIYYRALVLNNLGNVLLKQGRLIEAEAYLRQAIELWQQANDDVSLANSLGTLGEVFALQGQTAAAISKYDQAILHLTHYQGDAWARQLLARFTTERQAL